MNTNIGTPGIIAKSVAGILALLLCTSVFARDKTDVIYMSNGDRLTGEIKQLERGKLVIGTDSMGEVRIEWKDVFRIQSSYEFQFERSDGTRVTSTIQDTPDGGEITLVDDEVVVAFRRENIVRISQIDDSFWDRLKGSLSFGYSFTKASDIEQLNLGFRATHRTEIRSLTLDGSTISSSDSNNETTNRSDLSFTMTRFRTNRWFNSYLLGLESNDELGLDLRTSAGGGIGRYFIQTNTSELSAIGGLIGTSEQLAGDASSEQNVEGLLGMEYSRFVFDDPTVDLTASLAAFPSITDAGRLRTQFDISLKWEIIKDLYWDLSYYNTYDSDPPSGSLSTTDYGIVTSVGWSF